MSGIAELVLEAEGQFAESFVVAGDGALQLTGPDGSAYPLATIGADKLSALVEGTLNGDQLTDLMVGRPVGLSLDVKGSRWRVLVEPGVNGLTIRGTRAKPRSREHDAPSEELDISLDEGAAAMGAGFANSATSGFGLVDPDNRELGEPSEIDRDPTPPPGAVDAFESASFEARPPPPTPNDAFASGVHDALPRGDDGFGAVALDPRPAYELESTLYEPVGAPSVDEATLLAASAEALNESEGSTLIMEHTPVAPHANEAALELPTRRMPAAESAPPFELPSRERDAEELELEEAPKTTPAAARPQGTLMAMRPPGLEERMLEQGGAPQPQSEERKAKFSVPRAPTGELPRSEELQRGALCFVRELADAVDAGTRMGMGVEVIHDEDVNGDRGPTVEQLGVEPGAALIVHLDDPSRILGWVLLRREEGFRVFVVTRAQRPEGARRILMGMHASDRIEAWLDAFEVVAMVAGEYMPL